MGWLRSWVRLKGYQKTKNGCHFYPSQVCLSVPSFVLALLFIPSFHVLRGYFLCFTQFGGSFYSQNVDKFCDTAPLITRTITDLTEPSSALLLLYITTLLTNVLFLGSMMRGIIFGSCLYSVWTWSAVQVAWSLQ